ncbi:MULTISPECIES: glycosyltransferase family 4 protein [Pseudomonas]|uniref:glycosyltransferase family 4 protein n=1 Tax=Pseudomonas TaxID=286 RepID=UPI00209D7C39|nr:MULTISPECIES: glycosyltransferase [Pseudomonas]MCP1455008.1 glycosyltransferase involved in cell wall biosynthesis [Pseudomonas kilonensis]UVM63016.1 glycosyltransferase [Pseudomonas sp. B21-010]WPN65159.1 glycosyltransferase [Pseudomonas sp. P9_32]WPN70910.1 glycosyltransferase [Pseudomonas sp. P9_35]
MKVIHVIVGLNIGGAELMLLRLSESFNNDIDQNHSIISLTDLGRLGAELRARGRDVTTLNMRGALDVPRVLFNLYKIFRKNAPDVVQTWMYHADLIGGVAARLAGVRNVIWGIRTTNVNSGVSRVTGWIRQCCAILSHFVPKLIICAANASRVEHERIGYNSAKMMVIPNGFDPEVLTASVQERQALRIAAGFSPEDLVVGSLGRYNLAKDHENFISTASLLLGDYPNVKFLLVGRDLTSENKPLMTLIRSTGYPERFVLLGERKDVPVCLKAMDIFCLHSRTEGFPNVLGEAMTMGLPCVATDVGDAAFLVGETGIVVEPQNPRALAEGLKCLISAGDVYRSDLGQKAQLRIYEHFTMRYAKSRFSEAYKKICPGK